MSVSAYVASEAQTTQSAVALVEIQSLSDRTMMSTSMVGSETPSARIPAQSSRAASRLATSESVR